jgi:RHS repeat-associated protein
MKAKKLLLLLAPLAPLFAVYQYYFSDIFTVSNSTNWTANGVTLTYNAPGLTTTDANGGSLISTTAVTNLSEYEVSTTLNVAASGGTYVTYLGASSNALSGPSAQGTYYAVEIQNPVVNGASCVATMAIYQKDASGITLHSSFPVPCHSGMVVRTVLRSSWIIVYLDGVGYYNLWLPSPAAGQPGVGVRAMPAGNSLARVDLGAADTTNPAPVNVQSVGVTAFPNAVDAQWRPPDDGPNGTGIAFYQIFRGGAWIMTVRTPEFSDQAVSAGTSYSYMIVAVDFHWNTSSATFTALTPPVNAIDTRRVGVRPLGAYWGGMGEQIDTRSGNLNFTLPLLKAQGRGGWGVTFALSYNSQLWRQDPGGTWKLGRDVGYGFGWQLMAGSLTPYWSDYLTIHHYVYTDLSGAEYRLDINTNGVWTSREGVYVSYDATNQRLYFPDGSFWVMGAVSAGTEDDAGVMYPTLMQDSNGNQVTVSYYTGVGVPWSNSSARIYEIRDFRLGYQAYRFTYNADAIPHLTTIQSYAATVESYTFTYSANQQLASPFTGTSYGTTTLLQSVANTYLSGLTHTFDYANTAGELTKVTFPFGGSLRWDYTSNTYMGSRTQREVRYRYLRKSAAEAETLHTFIWDPADTSRPAHSYTVLDDGASQKLWYFNLTLGSWYNGVLAGYEERPTGVFTTDLKYQGFWWVQDINGTPYINRVDTTLDTGTAYATTTRTDQTIDTRGNVLSTTLYNYVPAGQTPAVLRTYTNTYLTDSNYTSRYIFNRLLTTSVSGISGPLLQNTYDQVAPQDSPYGAVSHDPSYGTSFLYRGNVTLRTTPASTQSLRYNITGTLVNTSDSSTTVAITPAVNDVGPGVITPNGNANLSQTLGYNSYLVLTSVTGPNGAVSTTNYDTYGRVTSTVSVHGATTTYAYDYVAHTQTATTNGRWVKATTDGLGRTIKVERGDGSVTKSIVDSVYGPCACSPMGKVIQVSQPYAPGQTPVWTVYTYDAMGRTLTARSPDGASTTTYVYQGNKTTVTDAAGKWKTTVTDPVGNIIQVTEPNPSGGTVDTFYTYNALNKLTQVQMPRAGYTQTRTFTYDNAGRVLTATNPENGTITYTYTADGLVATKTDAKNQQVQYSYDTYKRLTQVRRYVPSNTPPYPPVEDVNQRTDYYYDTNPFDTISQNSWGRLAAVVFRNYSPGTFTYMYSYTTGGLITKKRMKLTRDTWYGVLDAAYEYDNEGRTTSVTYPSGGKYTYSFDSMGRPNQLTDPNNAVVVSGVSYGAADQLTQITYDGRTETRVYNSRFQLTRLTVPGSMDLEYRYSTTANNGQITQQKDWLSGEEVNYTYDSLARLIQAATTDATWGVAYGYDGYGNLLSKGPVTGKGVVTSLSQAVDPVTNHIVGKSYDANGNQIDIMLPGSYPGLYDVENRLIVTTPGGESYGYDPSNKRVWKMMTDGVTEEIYFYGVDGRRLGTYKPDAPGTMVQLSTNLYFAGKLIRSQGQTAAVDRLGSLRWSSGTNYYPYGEEVNTTTQNRDKFATYYRDAATGLDYADQRYYSSVPGRFLTPDPYRAGNRSGDPADPQSWNRYSYTAGDPINRLDPTGRAWCDPSHPMCDQGSLFDPAPQPQDPPDPDQPPEPLRVTNFHCTITLMYRPVNSRNRFLKNVNHTYLVLTKSITFSDGSTINETDLVEALPENPAPPWGRLIGWVYYDIVGGFVPQDIRDRPISDAITGSISGGLDICLKGGTIENQAWAFPKYPYDASSSYYGVNSNFFTWKLLSNNGLYLGVPPRAPGFPGSESN